MKAAVLYGREEIRVESLEEGVLLAGEVRVRIGAALTCGTDLKGLEEAWEILNFRDLKLRNVERWRCPGFRAEVVEPRRFELLTPTMPLWCSTN